MEGGGREMGTPPWKIDGKTGGLFLPLGKIKST